MYVRPLELQIREFSFYCEYDIGYAPNTWIDFKELWRNLYRSTRRLVFEVFQVNTKLTRILAYNILLELHSWYEWIITRNNIFFICIDAVWLYTIVFEHFANISSNINTSYFSVCMRMCKVSLFLENLSTFPIFHIIRSGNCFPLRAACATIHTYRL